MISPVILFDDPRLTQWASAVNLSDADDIALLQRFIRYADLSDMIVESAPVYGINKRILSIKHDGKPIILMNPVLAKEGGYNFGLLESWPGMSGLKIPMRRPEYVDVQAFLPNGEGKSVQIRGQAAQLVHWHLQLLNGCAPISSMTGFEQFLAFQLLYLRTEAWPLLFQRRLCALPEKIKTQSVDPQISFDGNRHITIPGLIGDNAEDMSRQYQVDLRDPFMSLTFADRYLLRFFASRLMQAKLCLTATYNPMLAAATILMAEQANVVTITDPKRQSILPQLLDGVTSNQIRQVGGRLEELEIRERPEAILADWQWSDVDPKSWQRIIRNISKKLSAEGVLILSMADDATFEKVNSIFTKIFPQCFLIRNDQVKILFGARSINASCDTFQINSVNAVMPWMQHDIGRDPDEVVAVDKLNSEPV